MISTEGQLCSARNEDTHVIVEFVTGTRELLAELPSADPLRAADLAAHVSRAAEFLMLGQIETLALQCSASFRMPIPPDTPRRLEAIALLQTLVDAVERTQTDTGMEARVEAMCRSLGAPDCPLCPPELGSELLDDQQLLSAAMTELFKDQALGQIDQVEAALLQAEEGTKDPELLHGAFRAMHSFKGNCGCVGLFDLEEVAHRTEDLLDELRRGERELDGDFNSVVLLVLDAFREATLNLGTPRGKLAHKAELLERLNALQGLPRERPRENRPKPTRTISMNPVTAKVDVSGASRFVPVEVTKLNAMLDYVGELISASASVVQSPDLRGLNLDGFQVAAGRLARATAAVHDAAIALRMIPLQGLFDKMTRVVHDLRQRLGKRVDLEIEGERTEVAKSVMESIADPLVHIIRNAVDHGIESETERRRANKPSTGTIRLSAEQRDHEVWITVEDDGRGIDPKHLVESAIHKGLISHNHSEMSVQEAYQLMFLPGFSTASDVTYVSGRGVGMDVVRRQLEAIGGRVEIHSDVGLGSRFIIRLPLGRSGVA